MNIQIREDVDNKLSNSKKKINVKIPTDKQDLMEGITFSFWAMEYASGEIFHSGTANQNTFLNYGNTVEFDMELTLPAEGSYDIKIVAQELTISRIPKTVVSIDAEGLTTEEIVDYDEVSYPESNSSLIQLTYSTENVWQ